MSSSTVLTDSFKPCAFPDWFLVTWPEPASWLTARLSYARTLAVMSMIGYVLGYVYPLAAYSYDGIHLAYVADGVDSGTVTARTSYSTVFPATLSMST